LAGAGGNGFFQAGGKLGTNLMVEMRSARRVRLETEIQNDRCFGEWVLVAPGRARAQSRDGMEGGSLIPTMA
jgi:hypothetical protein